MEPESRYYWHHLHNKEGQLYYAQMTKSMLEHYGIENHVYINVSPNELKAFARDSVHKQKFTQFSSFLKTPKEDTDEVFHEDYNLLLELLIPAGSKGIEEKIQLFLEDMHYSPMAQLR